MLALLLVLAPSSGDVDPEAMRTATELKWEAPAGCPQREDVKQEIETLIDAPLEAERAVPILATGEIEAAAEGYVLTLTVESESGARTRSLSAGDCRELSGVATLLIAVAIDPGIAERLGVTEEPLAEEPEPPPEAGQVVNEPGAGRPPEPESSSTGTKPQGKVEDARKLRGGLGVMTGLNLGALPSATAAVRGFASLSWRWLRAELGAAHRFVRPSSPVPGRPGRAFIWNTVGQLDFCGVPRVTRVEFPLCVGVEAGTLTGRSERIENERTGRGPWVAMRARAGLIVMPWKRLGLLVGADTLFPISRTGFEIEGIGEVYRVGAVGVDVLAGLEVRLP